mmetsp:Transcript_2420/g.3508  ORF Transcript_2420/g.3508 Transcript_2420/m.3508 type:complete len:340 (+) Transcript_2420:76-1095(+)
MGGCLSERDDGPGASYQILLLGSGSSGKSTICKQIRLMYGRGLDERLLNSYGALVRLRTIECMQQLVSETKKRGGSETKFSISPDLEDTAEKLLKVNTVDEEAPPKDAGEYVAKLWKDPGIQATYERKSEFNLMDNAKYFLDKADTIFKEGYTPDSTDALRISIRTSGLVTTYFQYNGTDFVMIDVGGQESERRKWKCAFQTATSVLFVADISAYDQFYETKLNKLVESMDLFQDLVKLPELKHVSFVLFLNKIDIFKQKLGRTKLHVCPALDDYKGDEHNFNEAAKHIQKKFNERVRSNRQVYTHFTCAIDTENVRKIFEDVIGTVVGNTLAEGGLIS